MKPNLPPLIGVGSASILLAFVTIQERDVPITKPKTDDLYAIRINGGLAMWTDEVLEEIYAIREEHAKAFNYDLQAICDDLRRKQAVSGGTIVSQPLKPKQQHPPFPGSMS